ncbi:MAG: hypothetical protein F6K22_02110 [Okeania sp. SIO2F4]|uniref:hypothetical protein n=1 Tax=Okeania sp. SIO2F4 TaxID=2607790 RepID=UPI001429F41A|nr:hypothetical protein [Okeania sp. SIO2F4]NES01720.1 hypothetical protein [Okeania sp. SIO2F4]
MPSTKCHLEINSYIKTGMSPEDYCRIWVPVLYKTLPEQRGYKARCIEELAKVTGFTEQSIKNWGADFKGHPDYVKVILKQANIINEFRQLFKKHFGDDT